jgi:hypothetical protein
MANIVRGFRRIGFVLTVPLAALSILVFFDTTKEFSASDYESALHYDYGDLEIRTGQNTIEMPGAGYAQFSKDVPLDVASKVIANFTDKSKAQPVDWYEIVSPPALPPPPKGFKLDPPGQTRTYTVKAPDGHVIELEGPADASTEEIIGLARRSYKPSWNFTVHKKVNKLKLTGLVIAAITIPGLVSQGLISIFAWVIRGFRQS